MWSIRKEKEIVMSDLDYQQATEKPPEQPEPHAPHAGVPQATLGIAERTTSRSWFAGLLPTIIGFTVTIILVALLLAWWL
jgi:hypothetical protein